MAELAERIMWKIIGEDNEYCHMSLTRDGFVEIIQAMLDAGISEELAGRIFGMVHSMVVWKVL